MAVRSLDEIDLTKRRVFVRADLNVPLRDGVILDDSRIRSALPTLQRILEAGGSAVVAAHVGRLDPEGGPLLGLAPVAARLRELLKVAVDLAPLVVGREVAARAARLQACSVLLLENVRYHPGEIENDPEFSRQLASLADAYVNDAFGSCHRAHASVVGVPACFAARDKAAGLQVTGEIRAFDRVLGAPEHPLVAVLGGAGLTAKSRVLRNLLPKAGTVLLAGGVSTPFLQAREVPTGDAPVEPEEVELARKLLAMAEANRTRILLPVDHVIARRAEPGSDSQTTGHAAVPPGSAALDLGPKTLTAYAEVVSEARTVVWNGPVGVTEVDPFSRGTLVLAEAVAGCAGFTLVAGRSTVAAVKRSGYAHRIDHISTGDDAAVVVLEGRTPPGIAALDA